MYQTVERCDLIDAEFETTWIEIKNKNSKNMWKYIQTSTH